MRRYRPNAKWINRQGSQMEARAVVSAIAPVTIVDGGTGASAGILAAAGFNCFSFRPVVDGTPVDVIWAEEGYSPQSAVDLNGIPLLFPFAGRLAGDTFAWEDRTYQVTGA